MEKITLNIQEARPTLMTGVPRLYEKIYDAIYEKGKSLQGIKKRLFFWAVDLGMQYEPYRANGLRYALKLGIARALIFKKWKAGMGGRLELMVSGSAPLQPRLARIFAAAGMPIMEGYGLTETSPVISVNDMRNGGFRIGTVGKIIDRVTVKIADDGEILVKGPNVMQGYYKDEHLTNEVMTNGYFHTGDIGEIDGDGFLKITDRKKDMFKTSGGKYIVPSLLENQLKHSRFIEQVIVIGEGEKMPAALIQPQFELLNEWLSQQGDSADLSHTSICQSDKVLACMQSEVDQANAKMAQLRQRQPLCLRWDCRV